MGIEITAPMPGSVLEVLVNEGERVSIDQELVILEAMKMEIPVPSVSDGLVTEIRVRKKDNVENEEVLVVLD